MREEFAKGFSFMETFTMKPNRFHSSVIPIVSSILLVISFFTLVGCTNTGAYQHTTVYRARAEELKINVFGAAPLIHVTDATLTVTVTTQISLGNTVMK